MTRATLALLLLAGLALVACSPGTYSVTYNGTPATCTVAEGTTTDYDVTCATATAEPTVVYREDFSGPHGWYSFVAPGGDQTQYAYRSPVTENGAARFSFYNDEYALKVDTNHTDADGTGKLSLAAFVYMDEAAIHGKLPCSGSPKCLPPLDLNGATFTMRVRIAQIPELGGTPGIVNSGPNAATGTRLGIWAQGWDENVQKAVNIYAQGTPLDNNLTGDWQTITISPQVSDWICLGSRENLPPDNSDLYGCSLTMEDALSMITRDFGLIFYNVDSTWNPGDPGSYDPALDNLPYGRIEIDWFEITR